MITVRGENVYPSAIEDVLRGFDQLGTEFEVVVRRTGTLDELLVRVEAPPAAAGFEARVIAALRAKLGVRPELELLPPNTLARTDLKSRRVRDERGLYRT